MKWGGNYNCIYCTEHEIKRQHRCKKYKTNLRLGRNPGKWVLPCAECHVNKTYGGKEVSHDNRTAS